MNDGKPAETWCEIVVRTLETNEVRFATYAPDNVIAPLIRLRFMQGLG